MGYTYYWLTFPRTAQVRAAWPAITGDSATITAEIIRLGTPLHGPDGTGAPLIGRTRISLNGPASDDDDGWGEAFDLTAGLRPVHYQPPGLPRGAVWSFCKTGRNPYDLAVTAILLRASQHAPPGTSAYDFTRGDFVRFGGHRTWYEVVRVNAKSVTIPAMIAGPGHAVLRAADNPYSWTDTVPYHKVTGRASAAEIAAPADPPGPGT